MSDLDYLCVIVRNFKGNPATIKVPLRGKTCDFWSIRSHDRLDRMVLCPMCIGILKKTYLVRVGHLAMDRI